MEPPTAAPNKNKVKNAINKAIKILTGANANSSTSVIANAGPSSNKTARIQALQKELKNIKAKTASAIEEYNKTEDRRAENIINAEGPGQTHWVKITPKNGSEVYYEGAKSRDRIYESQLPKNHIINKESNNSGDYAPEQKGGSTNQNNTIAGLEKQIVVAKKELEVAEKDLNDIRDRQAKDVIAAEGPGITEWIKRNTEHGLIYEGVKGHGTIWPNNLPKNAKIKNAPKTGGKRKTMKKRKTRQN